MKKGNLDTKTHIQGERHVKMKAEWGDSSISQGVPKTARKPPEARQQAWYRFSFTAFRRKQHC